jgi:hypothetical protein
VSEQDNGLHGSLTPLLMRRSALPVRHRPAGQHQAPDAWEEFGYPNTSTSTNYRTMAQRRGFAVVHRFWMVAGRTIRSSLTVMKQGVKRQRLGKESHQVHEEAVAEGEGCRSPQYGWALLRAALQLEDKGME